MKIKTVIFSGLLILLLTSFSSKSGIYQSKSNAPFAYTYIGNFYYDEFQISVYANELLGEVVAMADI